MEAQATPERELKPRILVFGVGGAGGNAVANMIEANLEGVDFVVANTDSQALKRARDEHRFQLGPAITEGLGAGARPEIGRRAAEDSLTDLVRRMADAHMVFITAGMGGGTGTGAAPVIARAARDAGALVVAVVTKPFEFEGGQRMSIAEEGLKELEREVDTLIVIPNQNLFRLATETTSIADAFAMADEVLHSGVRGVTDLMTRPGLVNLDFADVRTVMNEMGQAVMGAGEADGPRRAADAAAAAVSNPLLDDITLKGATAVLINITGGPSLTLYDVDEAANAIRAEIDPDANIIFGSAIDESLGDRIRVSVVATGMAHKSGQKGGQGAHKSERSPRRARVRTPAWPEASIEENVAAAGFTIARDEDAPAPAPAAETPSSDAEAPADAPEMDAEADVEAGADVEAAATAYDAANEDEPEDVLELTADQMAPPEAEDDDIDAADAAADADAEASAGEPDEAAAASFDLTQDSSVEAAPPLEVRRMDDDEERAARSGGFSIFGRRKRREEREERRVAPEAPTGSVDEAEESEDDDLEIPAFLRRQAN